MFLLGTSVADNNLSLTPLCPGRASCVLDGANVLCEEVSMKEKDASGYKPDYRLINRQFRHHKTGDTYIIKGFIWDGDVDLWKIVHYDIWDDDQSQPFCRTPANFFANVSPGVPRFTNV